MKLILALAITAAAFCANAGSVTTTKKSTRTPAEADRRIKTVAEQTVVNLYTRSGEKAETECRRDTICKVRIINSATNETVAIYKVDIDETDDGSKANVRVKRLEQNEE